MKISTKGRYALRMLIDLAEHQSDGYVALKDIASRQDISKKYLEQIVPILNKNGILKTNRGFQGGYMLAKGASKLSVGEILRLTEDSLSPTDYDEQEQNGIERVMIPVWQELDRVINRYLDSVTIQDILDSKREQYANDYMI
ncbi:MAG: Rrf2 family transcriptional regulator [Oscillospiraceae bacterium]|nr:Rrf2 family transcriptional regulator [Oscillospiraceae bacterium]MCH5208339.1 Rrf2 family transcriptional regulator [Oscillospiraceae bacterium]